MTELIVALDGPKPLPLLYSLQSLGINWFKVGPATLLEFPNVLHYTAVSGAKIFLDLKLADTTDTCKNVIDHATDLGVTAISTYTDEASEACMRATNDQIQIWRVLQLTSAPSGYLNYPSVQTHGIIAPISYLACMPCYEYRICPGVRFVHENKHNHFYTTTPDKAAYYGASHIVVGRPIWMALDPLKSAKDYLNALTI